MPAPLPNVAPKPLEPITDSPWLWFALFTGFGLAALLATGGKFGRRQANIEHQYQARAAVASGKLQVEEGGTGLKKTAGAPEYTTPEAPAIPIWPLEIILGVLCAVSFVLLLRQRMGGDYQDGPQPEKQQPAAPP
jgi:hypothetical protein